MSRCCTINRDDIDRACTLARIVEPHRLRECRPRRTVDECVSMPRVQVSGTGRGRCACSCDGRLRAKMLDDSVVPVFAILMPEDQIVSWHRSFRALFLEILAFLGTLAESSLGEVNVIHIRAGCRLCRLRCSLSKANGGK